MLSPLIEILLPELISILEIMGILVITSGACRSLYIYTKSQIIALLGHRESHAKEFTSAKLVLGRALELGLEYKMGSEILKTVLIRDMSEIWVLASIISIRTLLFFLLHFELRAEEKHETPATNVSTKA